MTITSRQLHVEKGEESLTDSLGQLGLVSDWWSQKVAGSSPEAQQKVFRVLPENAMAKYKDRRETAFGAENGAWSYHACQTYSKKTPRASWYEYPLPPLLEAKHAGRGGGSCELDLAQ